MDLNRNVWVLMCGQALSMSIPSAMAFISAIIGQQLAPDSKYATLPMGAFLMGSAIATLPVILSMRRWGRKPVFLVCCVISALGSSVAIQSLTQHNFWLFCIAGVLLGLGLAAAQQYRFAAMESVTMEKMPEAASRVLVGGIIAAVLGPEVVVQCKQLFDIDYAGSFVGLIVIAAAAFMMLLFYQEPAPVAQQNLGEARPLSTILAQPVIWAAVLAGLAAFAIMSTVMVVTPLHMHVENGHSLADTKWVIQSHIVAMFLPSLFVPMLVRKVGEVGLIGMGALAFIGTLITVFSRYELINYWVALVMLGIGWNFLFVGGTSLLPRGYRESERFKVQAFNDFTVFGVQSISAVLASWLLYRIGWQSVLLLMIPILSLLAATIWYWLRSQRTVAASNS